MSKMGYKKEERPRIKAGITRLFVTGILRDHPKSFFLRNFVEYYLSLNSQESTIFSMHIDSFVEHTNDEGDKMILAKVFQDVEDKRSFEIVTNLIAKGCDWKFIRETTGINRTKYFQLKKAFSL